MFELIRTHQLNFMLVLCGVCIILIILLMNTRFLSKSRKTILILMELTAFFLLLSDRLAILYDGVPGKLGAFMVRFSNFMLFFLTSAIVLGLNLYLKDLLTHEGGLVSAPRPLLVVNAVAVLGMMLSIVAAFTNLYFSVDEANFYHREPGFLIACIIPVFCPIVQYIVIRKHKEGLSRLIYISLALNIFLPLLCGVVQIFTYGISIVNMALAVVSISMYIFMYLDLNNKVTNEHELEVENLKEEHRRKQRLFDQMADVFVRIYEKKDASVREKALRTAKYAEETARLLGKSGGECEEAYYAALLRDVGSLCASEDKSLVPAIGGEVLSGVTEIPSLAVAAQYSHERYDGTGYPDGLKGEEIPEIARIIYAASRYASMTFVEKKPDAAVREAFLKGAGAEFDPAVAKIMITIMDAESEGKSFLNTGELETELEILEYRAGVSNGIPVETEQRRIRFSCEMPLDYSMKFSAPSIILFDSYDGRVHDHEKTIEGYHYLEYGEVWFDRNSITTEARRIEERKTDGHETEGHFEILAGRYEDHIKLIMRSKGYAKEVVAALPGGSKNAYIALTGENCRLKDIVVEKTGEVYTAGDIERIAEPVSFIDHLESDIANVQIDEARSASTEGIEIRRRTELDFHSMSLPGTERARNCPWIVLYGPNDEEYALIRLNGEREEVEASSKNSFAMQKKADFPGWEAWKAANRKGLEYVLSVERKGKELVLKTETLGISIENTTTLADGEMPVYLALTGEQVALTDIRVYER